MSESLPGPAPLEDPAATSDEVIAPELVQEVATESAPGVKTVDAARFNGLMGKFNQTQSALDEARRRITELESTPAQEETAMTDVSGLQTQVSQLTSMLMEERLESARTKAIQDFPGAAAFADLIVADSPEAVRDMAKVLHERVTQGQVLPGTSTEGETGEPPAPALVVAETPPAAPVAPVVAGGTSIEGPSANSQDSVVEAIKNRSFPGFLKAKWEAQQAAGELVL